MSVYIFGAGASKAEGAPATQELLREAFNDFQNDSKIRNIKKFINDIFYINCDTAKKLPTYENVLNIIDSCILDDCDLSRTWSYQELVDLRSDLIYGIAKILEERLRSSGKIHKDFVKKLFNTPNVSNNNTSFINLNYDILLDNALIDLFVDKNYDLDYGLNFRNEINYRLRSRESNEAFLNNSEEWHKPRNNRSIQLLKPHGSLNWIYCPNCQTIKITKKEKGVLRIWTNYESCEIDGSKQRPLVIPPTWHKKYDNLNLTKIWIKTNEILRNAKKVYFIGYSLPDADYRLRYLFKKKLYKPEINKRPLITVITDSKNRDLKDRYNSLFGPNIEYYYEGFAEYINDM